MGRVDSDGGLAMACGGGTRGAWDSLVRGHAGLVYAVLRRCGFDGDEAADLFQDVWVAAWEQRRAVHDDRELAGWLTTLAARRAKRALEVRGLGQRDRRVQRTRCQPRLRAGCAGRPRATTCCRPMRA